MSTRVQLIGDNSVDSGSIVNATIKTEDILDSAVTESKIGTGSVTNTKLAAASVTADKLASGAAIPSGVIVMWSGTTSNIPTGWALCDGANGTPDLRDRFIVGAGSGYDPGNTGGANSVTLTVHQIPSHNHLFPGDDQIGERANGVGGWLNRIVGYFQYDALSRIDTNNSNMYLTSDTGGNQAHENRPPYYALAYIMKS